MSELENKLKAFEKGGVDYIIKPFEHLEVLARINTQVEKIKLIDELNKTNYLLYNKKEHLKYLVKKEIEKNVNLTLSLVTVLESANLYNDEDTGNHIKRVSKYSGLVAKEYGCDLEFIEKIELYSSLHDVGKVGISDAVLKKPGKYIPEEFELMKQHVVYGGRMLDNESIDIMAKNIALYHHEKWDGTGYVQKLKGKDIPLEARIVAVADVFDALTTKRVYKPAFSQEKAEMILSEGKGQHFDPEIIDCFFKRIDDVLKIKEKLQD